MADAYLSESDESTQVDSHEETWSDWDEEVNEGEMYKSLFTDDYFGKVEECFDFDSRNFGFDLRNWQKLFKWTFYECMQVVNFIRSNTSNSSGLRSEGVITLMQSILSNESVEIPWRDEKYLIPHLPDDALLHELPSQEFSDEP